MGKGTGKETLQILTNTFGIESGDLLYLGMNKDEKRYYIHPEG